MHKYYIEITKNKISRMSGEKQRRLNFLRGMPAQNYFFQARVVVLKMGCEIPSRFIKEEFLRRNTCCPIYYGKNGSRKEIGQIVYKHEKKTNNNTKDGKSKIETVAESEGEKEIFGYRPIMLSAESKSQN